MELFFRAKQSPFEYPSPLYKVKGLGYPGQTDPSTPTFPLLLSAPVTQGLPCHTSPTLDGHRQWFPHLAWRTPLRACYLTFRRNLGNFQRENGFDYSSYSFHIHWMWLLGCLPSLPTALVLTLVPLAFLESTAGLRHPEFSLSHSHNLNNVTLTL